MGSWLLLLFLAPGGLPALRGASEVYFSGVASLFLEPGGLPAFRGSSDFDF